MWEYRKVWIALRAIKKGRDQTMTKFAQALEIAESAVAGQIKAIAESPAEKKKRFVGLFLEMMKRWN